MPELVFGTMIVDRDTNIVLLREFLDCGRFSGVGISCDNHRMLARLQYSNLCGCLHLRLS